MLSTAFSTFVLSWCGLFLFDYLLRAWNIEWYCRFVEKHSLVVSPFQIRFYWTRFHNHRYYSPFKTFQTWSASSRFSHFVTGWFTIGTLIALLFFFLMPLYLCWLLFTEILNWISIWQWSDGGIFSWLFSVRVNSEGIYEHAELGALPSAITYVPYQNHVQTGLIPAVLGINIPISHLPMFMIVLIFAGILHELGHAMAALCANVGLNGFGFFLLAIYAGAFTELDTEELNRASLAQKLRIYSAGIFHNVVLALVGVLIISMMPLFLFPLYTTNVGVIIKDVEQSSGLYGKTGLIPGSVVTAVNGCKVRNASDWMMCLENLRKNGPNSGYLMKHDDVLPMLASANYVKQYGDEIQCCEGFSNETFSSHLCFNYYFDYVTKKPAEDQYHNQAPQPLSTTAAAKLSESLGFYGKNHSLPENRPIRSKRLVLPMPKSELGADITNRNRTTINMHVQANYACLPARLVTKQQMCIRGVTNVKDEYVCVTPSLYNGTQLLSFELSGGKDVVLFVGPVTEPAYLVQVKEIVPRFHWVPVWIADSMELFGQYLITFSLSLGVLNSVPCYGLDGQFLCYTVVDYFFANHSAYTRNRITSTTIFLGTMVFLLNLLIGFVKLFLYMR
ncbi:Endopeptidase S2P [Aphelenchoides besseyi]|nr:Endopeptidase S2P [Aphelenchoides besseyi]